MHLPDRSVTVSHLGHFIISTSRPQYLNLLTFRVSDDLSANVGLVCLVENVDAKINNQVGIIDFFIRSETKLLDTESLTPGQAWHTSHQLLNICGLSSVIPGSTHLAVELLDVFHCPCSIVCWNGSRLADGMDVTHIVNGR